MNKSDTPSFLTGFWRSLFCNLMAADENKRTMHRFNCLWFIYFALVGWRRVYIHCRRRGRLVSVRRFVVLLFVRMVGVGDPFLIPTSYYKSKFMILRVHNVCLTAKKKYNESHNPNRNLCNLTNSTCSTGIHRCCKSKTLIRS